MADFNGTILTDKGRNLLAKALTGTELKFTKVSLGDGVWDDSVAPEYLTELLSKKIDLAINDTSINCGLARRYALKVSVGVNTPELYIANTTKYFGGGVRLANKQIIGVSNG